MDIKKLNFFFFEAALGINLIRELFIGKSSPGQAEKVEKKLLCIAPESPVRHSKHLFSLQNFIKTSTVHNFYPSQSGIQVVFLSPRHFFGYKRNFRFAPFSEIQKNKMSSTFG